MFRFLLTIAVVVMAYGLCWSTIINIPADYSTIQQGIDAGRDGDTVLVQPGTYYENIDFNGNDVLLGSMFIMTADTSYISSTIIDGGNVGIVIKIWRGERGMAGVTGFTIQNGQSASDGGGIYIGGATPIISHNIIQNNMTSRYGAGLYFSGGGGLIKNNIIRNNTSTLRGAGICSYGGDCLIIGNIIYNNTAYSSGGGIMNHWSYSLILGNVIFDNYSSFKGGGICYDGTGSLINNVIFNNTADNAGGGVRLWSDANLTMINNIVRQNIAPSDSEIRVGYGATVSVSYTNIEGGWQGIGNIDLDPLFRNPLNADFHLMSIACGDSADSPCIDAGHPDSLDLILGCFNGLGGERSDMGAYGGGYIWSHNCSYEVGDVNGDNIFNGLDMTYSVAYFKGNSPAPTYSCHCTYGNSWYVSGDLNGSCTYNGLDVTYGISYFKGNITEIFPCPKCPPIN